jgi:hypothetical protein
MNLILFSGWSKLSTNGKRHYFKDGVSICSKWKMFEGSKRFKGGDDCPKCQRAIEMKRAA